MDQTTQSSNTLWYIVSAVVLIALAFWYFSAKSPTVVTTPTASDNTTAAISSDLSQIPDVSADLDAAAAASAQAVSGF